MLLLPAEYSLHWLLTDDFRTDRSGKLTNNVGLERTAWHVLVRKLDRDLVLADLLWVVRHVARAIFVVDTFDLGLGWAFHSQSEAACENKFQTGIRLVQHKKIVKDFACLSIKTACSTTRQCKTLKNVLSKQINTTVTLAQFHWCLER